MPVGVSVSGGGARRAMAGRDRDDVLSPDWPILEELHAIEPMHPAILDVARGSFRHKQPPAIRGTGYVVDSLEAALWAFHRASTFSDAVLAAVNLGDDADRPARSSATRGRVLREELPAFLRHGSRGLRSVRGSRMPSIGWRVPRFSPSRRKRERSRPIRSWHRAPAP